MPWPGNEVNHKVMLNMQKRTLRTPYNPTAEITVEDVKYTKRSAHRNLKPLASHLSLNPSHSDSCSPLNVNERNVEATWTDSIALVMHPKSVMSVEAVLGKFIVRNEDKRKIKHHLPSKHKTTHGGRQL